MELDEDFYCLKCREEHEDCKCSGNMWDQYPQDVEDQADNDALNWPYDGN